MRAFAPASVTTVFAPPAPESGETRSRGASIALADGVTVDVGEATETTVRVEGAVASFEPVERVLSSMDVEARVEVSLGVPLGSGFGASGAATLSTALAANELFDCGYERSELLSLSHDAEVASSTGLGDVFVQDVGGFVMRAAGGGLLRAEPTDTVSWESYGGISTSEVLGDDETMALISEHGNRTLQQVTPEIGLDRLFDLSWAFARETGLVTEQVTETIERVATAGGAATMAMVGETVIAVGADGELANQTSVATEGARLL